MLAIALFSMVLGVGFYWLAFSRWAALLYLVVTISGMAAVWRYRAQVRRAVHGSI
jgi:hypothetical protein